MHSSRFLILGNIFVLRLGIALIFKLIDFSYLFVILLVGVRESDHLYSLLIWVCQLSMACVCDFLSRLIAVLWNIIGDAAVILFLVILISAYPIDSSLSFFVASCHLILKVACLK